MFEEGGGLPGEGAFEALGAAPGHAVVDYVML